MTALSPKTREMPKEESAPQNYMNNSFYDPPQRDNQHHADRLK